MVVSGLIRLESKYLLGRRESVFESLQTKEQSLLLVQQLRSLLVGQRLICQFGLNDGEEELLAFRLTISERIVVLLS